MTRAARAHRTHSAWHVSASGGALVRTHKHRDLNHPPQHSPTAIPKIIDRQRSDMCARTTARVRPRAFVCACVFIRVKCMRARVFPGIGYQTGNESGNHKIPQRNSECDLPLSLRLPLPWQSAPCDLSHHRQAPKCVQNLVQLPHNEVSFFCWGVISVLYYVGEFACASIPGIIYLSTAWRRCWRRKLFNVSQQFAYNAMCARVHIECRRACVLYVSPSVPSVPKANK